MLDLQPLFSNDTECHPACIGLLQCTFSAEIFCCNYYTREGLCTTSCPQGTIAYPDNTCDCPPGMTGPQCEVIINFCNPEPCMNSGNCSSLINGYSCLCTPDFTGNTCETRLTPTTTMPTITVSDISLSDLHIIGRCFYVTSRKKHAC